MNETFGLFKHMVWQDVVMKSQISLFSVLLVVRFESNTILWIIHWLDVNLAIYFMILQSHAMRPSNSQN